jgi:hypothetical protein
MRALLPLVLATLLGCASVAGQEGGNVCPESASLHCLTAPQCSYDRDRHCKVCECTKGIYNAVPPDERIRQ